MIKYRLSIDEVGNPDLEHSADPNHRFLSLTGVIAGLDHVRMRIHPEMEALKIKYFGSHPDDPIILHRKEIVNRSYPFQVLRNQSIEATFNEDLLILLRTQMGLSGHYDMPGQDEAPGDIQDLTVRPLSLLSCDSDGKIHLLAEPAAGSRRCDVRVARGKGRHEAEGLFLATARARHRFRGTRAIQECADKPASQGAAHVSQRCGSSVDRSDCASVPERDSL